MVQARDRYGRFSGKTQKTKKSDQITHVALILDRSGSMSSIRIPALDAFNQILRDVKTQAYKTKQETTVSLFFIDSGVIQEYVGKKAEDVQEITTYNPYGSTPLFDSVGIAVERLNTLPRRKNTAYLILGVTDGEENTSTQYGSASNPYPFSQLIKRIQDTGEFTVTFQMPPHLVSSFCNRFGVPAGNVRGWEATEEGTHEMQLTSSAGTQSYFLARSKGGQKVNTFYTDLSGVTSKDLKQNLTDLSQNFKSFQVDKEVGIAPFVEYKTGQEYKAGQAFYALTKPELLKKDRSILIQEKGKKQIWGGQEARDLLGLPTNQDVKVSPLNHTDKEIFVESRSHNRRLVRGTKVLVDTTLTKGKKPTWTA